MDKETTTYCVTWITEDGGRERLMEEEVDCLPDENPEDVAWDDYYCISVQSVREVP